MWRRLARSSDRSTQLSPLVSERRPAPALSAPIGLARLAPVVPGMADRLGGAEPAP